jgi:hypothetical protein
VKKVLFELDSFLTEQKSPEPVRLMFCEDGDVCRWVRDNNRYKVGSWIWNDSNECIEVLFFGRSTYYVEGLYEAYQKVLMSRILD